MENVLVLDGLCTWRSSSRLLLTGAATVLAFAGSLGIARGSPVVGCPSSPITLAMASQLDVPASDTPCAFTISDFLLAPDSEGFFGFSFFSDAGEIPTTLFYATNAATISVVNGVTTVGPTAAQFCYSAHDIACSQVVSPTTDNLGLNLGLGPFGVIDFEDANGDLPSIQGELSFSLSGTVGGQPATLGLTIYDDPFGPNGALIATPEPSTYVTLGIGVLAIVVFRMKIGSTVL